MGLERMTLGPGHLSQHAAPAGVAARRGDAACETAGSDCRLNLLLSWGGWRPDSWADRMAALLEPLGVVSHKARTARDAERVIRSTPIHVAVVDLGLPLDFGSPSDEAGARLLDVLSRLDAPPPVVVVRSPRSSREAAREMSAALRFDAFAVVDRRSADVELMLKILQRAMERFYHNRWPHAEHAAHCPTHFPSRTRF